MLAKKDFQTIIFNKESEAIAILNKLKDYIDKYGSVNVSDLNSIAELHLLFEDSTINRYGWTDLTYAQIIIKDAGVILVLPDTVDLLAELEKESQIVAKKNFDTILFNTRYDADHVLDSLKKCIFKYGSVSVSDLYAIAGLASSSKENLFGWVDLTGAEVSKSLVSEGYILVLPDTIDISLSRSNYTQSKKSIETISMNQDLINELYEFSDKYSGRAKELFLLATSEIQRLNLIVNKLSTKLIKKEK